jgi:hypothetical protein
MLGRMGRLRGWIERRRQPREMLDMWAGGDTGVETATTSQPQVEDEPDIPAAPRPDWTTDPPETIPPWRRRDRALIDAARAAGASAPPPDADAAAALARDLRRLADLHADSALSDAELIAGIGARLAAFSRREDR